MAITWRNVDAPNSAGALNALSQASRSIGGAFSGLQDTLRNAELADKDRLDRVRADNTATFMDNLYAQYKTPEALAAAQQSGAIDQMRSAYGNMIDRDKTRGAAMALQTSLQQSELGRRQYNNQVTDDNDAAGLSRAQMEAIARNKDGFQRELEGISDRNKGKAALLGFDTEGKWISRDQNAEEHKWKGQTTQSQLANAAQQRALTGLKIEEAKQSIADSKARREGEDQAFGIAQAYQAEVARNHSGLADLATKIGAPVTNGRVDMNRITSDQLATLKDAAFASKLDASVLDGGDTKFLQTQIDSISADPSMGRIQKEALISSLRKNVNTSGLNEVGSDLERRARNENALQAQQEKFGSLHEVPVATTDWEPYNAVLDKYYKDDLSLRAEVADQLGRGFIQGEGGSRWNPSPGELENLLMRRPYGWFDFSRENKAEDIRNLWAKDPRTLANLAQATNLGNLKRAQTSDRKAADKQK